MISRNYFTAITVAIGMIIFSGVILALGFFVTSHPLVLAFFAACALLTCASAGRMGAEIWNIVNENRVRFIGVYPISFIESDAMRRTLLVALVPFIVLSNAVWYFLPIATGLKRLIFDNGFWEANASALVTSWRRRVTVSDLAMAGYNGRDLQGYPEFPEDDVFRVDD